MPDVIISFTPASTLTRAVDALCGLYGYEAIINDLPNPETRNQFSKRMLSVWVRQKIVEWETGPALEAARVSVQSSVDSLSIT